MKYYVEVKNKKFEIEFPQDGRENCVIINSREYFVDFRKILNKGDLSILVDNVPYRINLEEDSDGYRLHMDGVDYAVSVVDERTEAIRKLLGNRAVKKDAAGEIRAPMPGLVVKVLVETGQTVKLGQGVIVVEAMKMENEIAASIDGVVEMIKVKPGQAVNKGESLLVIKN